MKYLIINILAFLLVFAEVFAQGKNNVVQINEHQISIDEFTKRLNSLPQTLNLPDIVLIENMLCTMIAETILSFEAKKNKLDSSEKIKLLASQFHDEALYEEWMNKEIRQKVTITESELKAAYPRFIEQRDVAYWVSESFDESAKLRLEIINGTAEKKPQTKTFEYSMALPVIEDAIYSLNDKEVSQPVKVDSVYYILKLLKKRPVTDYNIFRYQDIKPALEKRMRTRKENYLSDEKINSLMKEEVFEVNGEAYNFLLQQLYHVIYKDNGLKYEESENIQMELLSREIPVNNNFNQVLISFNDKTEWTVKDCWKFLSLSPYPLNYKNPEDLKPGLFDVIKRIILLKSVASDAAAKKYDKTDYVKSESGMWKSNLLAQAFINRERQNVTVDESKLIQWYDSVKNNFIKPELLKIIPLIVKTVDEAGQIYVRLSKGEKFRALSAECSINKTGSDINNPGVYITADMWGEIGKTAAKMNPGEVSEILKNSDSTYAIIALIEKKPAAPYKYDEIKDKLYSAYIDKELQKKLNILISKVLKNYDIKINREAVKKVKYFGGNMGVKKTHFPIRSAIPIFPLFDHTAKWYQGVTTIK